MEWAWLTLLSSITLILLLSPAPGREAAPERPPFPSNPVERASRGDDVSRSDRKFMLFSGANYYPGGGAFDARGFFSTLDAAMAAFDPAAASSDDSWAHVFDIDSGTVVAEAIVPSWNNQHKTAGWKMISEQVVS